MKTTWKYTDLAGNQITFKYSGAITLDELEMFTQLDSGKATVIAIVSKSDPNYRSLCESIEYYAKKRCSVIANNTNDIQTLFYALNDWINDLDRLKENVQMVFRVIN